MRKRTHSAARAAICAAAALALAAGPSQISLGGVGPSELISGGPDTAWASEDGSGRFLVKTGPAVPVEGEAGSYRFPQLEISGADPGRLIKSLTVQFTTAVDAADAIELPGDSRFAPNAGNKAVNRTLNCAAGATADEWRDYLRDNLKVRLASATQVRGLRIVAGYQTETDTYDYNSENGHYYRAVRTAVNWTDALRLAESAPIYMGLHPYLVTVTSQQEQDFVYTLINTNAWMAGTDDNAYASRYNNGEPTFGSGNSFKFYWVSGPEKGSLITEGKLGDVSSHISPGYANWYGANPDGNGDTGPENYLHFYADNGGLWNDWANNGWRGYLPIYVVEYGGMPEDDAEGLDEEWAKTDVKIDPTGSTLSSTVGDVPLGTPVEVVESVNGDEDVRTRLPGGGDRSADIERTFYVKDPGAPGGWRELSPEELPGGSPAHAGEYKVVSGAVKEVLDDGTEVPYAPAESVFAVTPKKVDASELFAGQSLEKVYDGEASIDAAGLVPDLSFALPGADVHVLFDAEAQLDDLSVAATMATISGIRLSGADAGDYRVEGLDSGALEVPAKVLPRELTVRAVPSVVWGRTGLPLSDTSGSPVSYRSDLAVYSGSGEWRPNVLAPRDGRVENGAVVSILGDGALRLQLRRARPRRPVTCGRPLQADARLLSRPRPRQGPRGRQGRDRPSGRRLRRHNPLAHRRGALDIGNYVLELVDGAVAVADDPAARPSGGKEPSPDLPRLPGFLEAAASEVASPEKPPLSPADIEKIVSEKSGARPGHVGGHLQGRRGGRCDRPHRPRHLDGGGHLPRPRRRPGHRGAAHLHPDRALRGGGRRRGGGALRPRRSPQGPRRHREGGGG